ncbi:NADPH:quinone reductase-like Zn-dependent oxidoreductase [Chryseobacterium sp. 7]|uniref:zinc-dependent alcohol dehydrogenase family protein n=1 Tax=Chryseobacterium sp. 7 TaxID=2035214 RepID=UPI000EB12F96|nr:zinc-dependent alcohol dehydrogenase family protein [Chryseobacterium sp. 7]RLJ30679.1 NADPH:quinone reductase-like Zn-dependent oxidoreductase [Chryseobacterium sp. 7]
MRALVLNKYGVDFEQINLPIPHVEKNEVLVKIYSSGVNPIDNKIRIGKAPYATPNLPAILGTDMAGVIEDVGEDVINFKKGDEVYGLVGGVFGSGGTLAEYVSVDANLIAKKPNNLTWKEAAAVPLVALTAWEGIKDRIKIQIGDKVLIHGGAGGVGHMALQLAKIDGAEVYTTVSNEKRHIVEKLGGIPIDYKQETIEDYISRYTKGEGFDVIYDTVGGETLNESFQAVKHYGNVASCVGFDSHQMAALSFRGASFHGIFVLIPLLKGIKRNHHGEILAKISTMIERKEIIPMLDPRTFSLDTALFAYKAVWDGSSCGRIVIDIQ